MQHVSGFRTGPVKAPEELEEHGGGIAVKSLAVVMYTRVAAGKVATEGGRNMVNICLPKNVMAWRHGIVAEAEAAAGRDKSGPRSDVA